MKVKTQGKQLHKLIEAIYEAGDALREYGVPTRKWRKTAATIRALNKQTFCSFGPLDYHSRKEG